MCHFGSVLSKKYKIATFYLFYMGNCSNHCILILNGRFFYQLVKNFIKARTKQLFLCLKNHKIINRPFCVKPAVMQYLEFSFFNNFSVMAQSPLRRKTTIPRCLAAGISNLSYVLKLTSFIQTLDMNSPVIRPNHCLKLLCQSNIFSDHILKTRDSIVAKNEPQLQGSESLA